MEFRNAEAENSGQGHAMDVAGGRRFRSVHIAVSIEPDATDLLFFFAEMRGDAAGGTRGDGVISAKDQGHEAFIERFLYGVAKFLAGVGDFIDVLGAFLANGHFLSLLHDDVSDVFDLKSEVLDAGLQTGNAQGGGPHINAAAAGAEVHWNTDDADFLRHNGSLFAESGG